MLLFNVGDLVEFVWEGGFTESDQVRNVFHYQISAGTDIDSQGFAAALHFSIMTPLLSYTTDILTYNQIRSRLLDTTGAVTDEDIFLIPSGSGQGLDAVGEALPHYDALAFRYNRPSSAFRHGYKRFAGPTESHQDNGLADGTLVAAMVALAAAMSIELPAYTLVDGLADTPIGGTGMKPIILQRVINGDLINPVNGAFPSGVSFLGFTTQTTRKPGRGI